MEEIILQQRNVPRAVTGRGFLVGVAGVIVKLALAQIAVNLLISLTGVGLLNIVFYVFAVVLLVSFMSRTVAGCTYTLKADALTLQKLLGDSTTSVTEIPLGSVVSVRPVVFGERLESSYRYVTAIDAAAAVPVRMRAAFGLSLVSASLARRLAGQLAFKQRGYAVVFEQEGKRQACVFLPDEAFLAALKSVLPETFGHDDRAHGNTPVTMMAQALERAFPALYVHVEPLISEERAEAARQEIARQKQVRSAKRTKEAESSTQEKAENQNEVQDDTL